MKTFLTLKIGIVLILLSLPAVCSSTETYFPQLQTLSYHTKTNNCSSFLFKLYSTEEKKVVIRVEDNEPSFTATAIIVVYSQDGQDELGPYTVTEGTLLKVNIDDREWGVRITDQSPGSDISWWIEE